MKFQESHRRRCGKRQWKIEKNMDYIHNGKQKIEKEEWMDTKFT